MNTNISSEINLSNQTAVVTGGAGDIGRAACESLAREGADIVAADINSEGLATAKSLVEDQGPACEVVECESTNTDDVDRLCETALDIFVLCRIAIRGLISASSLAVPLSRNPHTAVESTDI